MEIPSTFARESARYLAETYVPRLREALGVLPEGDLFWRPHAGALSFGTVLLHLEGNVRQWILSGLGGQPDARDRAGEFSATSGPDGAELLARLERTVNEAAEIISGLDAGDLAGDHRIQGFDTNGLEAVYHVVEHFAWHTGQAVWIAKARAGAGHGVAFYDEAAVNRARDAAD